MDSTVKKRLRKETEQSEDEEDKNSSLTRPIPELGSASSGAGNLKSGSVSSSSSSSSCSSDDDNATVLGESKTKSEKHKAHLRKLLYLLHAAEDLSPRGRRISGNQAKIRPEIDSRTAKRGKKDGRFDSSSDSDASDDDHHVAQSNEGGVGPRKRPRNSNLPDLMEDDCKDEETKQLKRMRYAIAFLTNPDPSEVRRLVKDGVKEAEMRRSQYIYNSLIARTAPSSKSMTKNDPGAVPSDVSKREGVPILGVEVSSRKRSLKVESLCLETTNRARILPVDDAENADNLKSLNRSEKSNSTSSRVQPLSFAASSSSASGVGGMQTASPKRRNKLKKTFPEKLMFALSCKDMRHAITWMPSGESFCIVNPKLLISDVLPRFFKQAKFESFTRKLKRWGFKRISSGFEYHHEFFKRDQPKLCLQMSAHNPPEQLLRDMTETDDHRSGSKDQSMLGLGGAWSEKGQELLAHYRSMGRALPLTSLVTRPPLLSARVQEDRSKLSSFVRQGFSLEGLPSTLGGTKSPANFPPLQSLNRILPGFEPVSQPALPLHALKGLQEKIATNLLSDVSATNLAPSQDQKVSQAHFAASLLNRNDRPSTSTAQMMQKMLVAESSSMPQILGTSTQSNPLESYLKQSAILREQSRSYAERVKPGSLLPPQENEQFSSTTVDDIVSKLRGKKERKNKNQGSAP